MANVEADFVNQMSMMNAPTSKIEISVACKKLKDKDIMSKSDPQCVLYGVRHNTWVELGRTEVVKNNLNPVWQKKFQVDYLFEQQQRLKFEVYDSDSKSTQLKKHDFLGRVECTLGSILASSGGRFISIINDGPSKGGQFLITAEEMTGSNDVIKMHFAARNLDKKDKFGKSDPYFTINKMTIQGQQTPIYKSKVIKNNLNPSWDPIKISARDLCNGDFSKQMKIDVYDWDQKGDHDLIGSFNASLDDLRSAAQNNGTFQCINPKKVGKKSYKNSGEVYLKHFFVENIASFVDYIQNGTALNFSVAVDFTASNGKSQDPRSLHYISSHNSENQYTTAIRAVGEIVQDYDTDKHFPALGFGAKIPQTGQVSHEFFLNLRQDSPFCSGVDGVLQAYYNAIQSVQLYGPTNFSPVINHVARFANTYQDGRQYFILLIITDGIITDMSDTKEAIVKASHLPMSIIIVGVGQEEFKEMEALDSDKGLLQAKGMTAVRDIVQFVEMRKFLDKDGMWNKAKLGKEVLAEVPKQVVGWMSRRGVKPKDFQQ